MLNRQPDTFLSMINRTDRPSCDQPEHPINQDPQSIRTPRSNQDIEQPFEAGPKCLLRRGLCYGRFLCDPSQRGILLLPLQPQNDTTPDSSASNFIGANADPLCDPSQNGCLLLLPQEHHQYDFPASTSIL